jgi:hydroxymethylbilane synthase
MGTRGSALALAQSGQVAQALCDRHPGLTIETVIIKTSGDLFGAPPPEIAKTLPQGAKGLWVKEIEQALLDGVIHFAVHSGKDLPADLAQGLTIAAYPVREDPHDVFLSRPGLYWNTIKPGAKIATSSLRRQLLMTAAKPGVVLVPLRGNVDTRLRKLRDGEFDAMVVAAAGLRRLGFGQLPFESIDYADMVPSPAQGALAIQVSQDRQDVHDLIKVLDDEPTRRCVEMERMFLSAVGGGCGSPVGALATQEPQGIRLQVYFAHEGAKSGNRLSGLCTDLSRRDHFVQELALQAKSR